MTWAPDYLDVETVKDYLDISDNADDALIRMWISAASRNVDDFAGRQFGQVDAAEVRYYPSFWDRCERAWYVEIDDVQDVTGLAVADSGGADVAAPRRTLLSRNAVAKGRPYTKLRITGAAPGEVAVTALWGWAAVPEAVETGLLLQAARLNARRKSPFGVAGAPTEGNVVRLLAKLDPDFVVSLKPYVRKWWVA